MTFLESARIAAGSEVNMQYNYNVNGLSLKPLLQGMMARDQKEANEQNQLLKERQMALQEQQFQLASQPKPFKIDEIKTIAESAKGLYNSGQVDYAISMLQTTIPRLPQGGQQSTNRLIQAMLNGDSETVNQKLDGVIGAKPNEQALSNSQKNYRQLLQLEDDLKAAQGTGNEEAIAEAERAIKTFKDLTGKFEIPTAEKLKIKLEHEQKVSEQKKLNEFASIGMESAIQLPNIVRSLALLDSVKTGGFNNALLIGKQFFGVDGANESELSTNLGRSVLSQLKQIFGSQFTEKEGARLERIEAGFGRGVEANKRLLNEVLDMTKRAARRGVRAAEKANNDFLAEEIQTILDSLDSYKLPALERNGGAPEIDNTPLTLDEQRELEELRRLKKEGTL